jgi:hypothetical protein
VTRVVRIDEKRREEKRRNSKFRDKVGSEKRRR